LNFLNTHVEYRPYEYERKTDDCKASIRLNLLETANDHKEIVEALKNKNLKKMLSLLQKGLGGQN